MQVLVLDVVWKSKKLLFSKRNDFAYFVFQAWAVPV